MDPALPPADPPPHMYWYEMLDVSTKAYIWVPTVVHVAVETVVTPSGPTVCPPTKAAKQMARKANCGFIISRHERRPCEDV